MRVYLAAAMTTPNRALGVVRALLEALESRGHRVLTAHVADPQGKQHDAQLSDDELARRDLAWLNQASCLVAEVSTPSHGVGAEVMAACQLGKPVLLLAQEAAPVSRFLLGLPGVKFVRYREPAQATSAVLLFMESLAGNQREDHLASQ